MKDEPRQGSNLPYPEWAHLLSPPADLPGDVPVDDAPSRPRQPAFVSDEAFATLYRVVHRAVRRGKLETGHSGVIGEVAWIHVRLGELDELEDRLYGTLQGDAESIAGLRSLLESAPRWPADRRVPGPPSRPLSSCPMRPINPFALVGAARMLDALGGEGGWVDRALGFYVSRAAPLEAALGAAASGRGLDEFAEVFRQVKPPAPEHGPEDSHSGHGGAFAERALAGPAAAFLDTSAFPDLPLPPRRWDPCTLNWISCAGLAGADTVEAYVPVLVGSVKPPAVCHGAVATLTLYPAPPDTFPAQPPGVTYGQLVLAVGGTEYPLTVPPGGWTTQAITVSLPPNVPAGCGAIYWKPATTFAEVLESRAEQCAGLFGPLRPPLRGQKPKQRGVGRVALIKKPTVDFRAGGAASFAASACTDVRLTWRVDAGLCAGALSPPAGGNLPPSGGQGGYAQVTIRAGGSILLANAPLIGELVVNAAAAETYTLTADAYAGSTLCGSTSASVSVTRTSAIDASAPDRVLHPGEWIPVTVRIPCAAHVGGVQVSLTSSNPALLANGSVLIPAGAREATAQMGPPLGQSGVVQVVASAPNHSPDTVQVLIHTSNCVPASFGVSRERYGGRWDRPVTITNVVGIHLAVLHTGKVLLFSYDEGTGTRGPFAAIMACLQNIIPALAACDTTWTSDRAGCQFAHAGRVAACNSTFACATAAQCNAFWATDPRRYACHAARAACLLARGICLGASEVVRGICRAAAWTKMALCKAGTILNAAVCAVAGVTVSVVNGIATILFGGAPAATETAVTIANSSLGKCSLWDPKTNAVKNIPLSRNLFCSGHCFLADGRLLVAAGQFPVHVLDGSPPGSSAYGRGAAHDLHVFDSNTETWTRVLPDMNEGRWYPTVVALPDSRVLVMSGNGTFFAGPGGTQNSVQVLAPLAPASPPGSARRPTEPFIDYFYHLYPFGHVLPSGEVLVHWKRRTATYDPTPTPGSWRWHWTGDFYGAKKWKETKRNVSRTGPGPGTSVLLPLIPTRNPNTGAVTYPRGKIMIIGGGGVEGEPDPEISNEKPYLLNNTTPATNEAEIVDYDFPDIWGFPDWRWTGFDQKKPSYMRHPRVMPDPVLLPDGTLLVVNGCRFGRSGGFLIHFGKGWGATQSVLEPEVFDPVTETWEELCPKPLQRFYHATAALLPDGRVVVAGHDGFLNRPGQPSVYQLETFSPPYLFRGPRPVISSAPATVTFNSVFTVDTDDAKAVASVALIRQSSITHQTNTDQRYVGLAMLPSSDPKRLSLQAPPHGGVAPPGFYMLFLVNQDGVPSEAAWVRVQ